MFLIMCLSRSITVRRVLNHYALTIREASSTRQPATRTTSKARSSFRHPRSSSRPVFETTDTRPSSNRKSKLYVSSRTEFFYSTFQNYEIWNGEMNMIGSVLKFISTRESKLVSISKDTLLWLAIRKWYEYLNEETK